MKPNMNINKKLLPIKGHYFLFNAGTAPLVPYLSTYARQLGFSSATVGLIYTVLPIFGLVAKPLFGVIADRFKIQKSIFILFQVVTIVSFSAIYLIPESASRTTVELDCDGGSTFLKGCYKEDYLIDQCKVDRLNEKGGLAQCFMECDMTSPKMWQTVCEHWQLPEYCFGAKESIEYAAHVKGVSVQEKCAYIPTDHVILDGYNFVPGCEIGGGYVDIDEPCDLECANQQLSAVIGGRAANMTCVNKTMQYRLCFNDTSPVTLLPKNITSDCNATCKLDTSKPWKLMEICDWWDADMVDSCAPRTKTGKALPATLAFTSAVSLSTLLTEHKCIYIALRNITLQDGSVHHSNCKMGELFKASCKMKCNEEPLNELFQAAADSHTDSTTQYTEQFWMFFVLMIISWIGQAVVVTFADAICFNLLGNKVSQYGKQRLWGSLGWGIFSLLTGVLIDLFSDGEYKNYGVAFVLMFIFMTGDIAVSCVIKDQSTKMSVSILSEVGTLVCSLPTLIFLVWTIAVGLCTGLLWQFLFWHLEDIAKLNCTGSDYIKTLQGLVSAIQTFCGEIPFMFLSGYILKRLGHVNMMSLVLFAFGLRFILYSLLSTNPWWVLPIEMLQGVTFGMFYPTMASYAKVVSPPGTETTVQGLVGAVFEGVGTSLGSFIGGLLYETHGGANTFQWFGIGALVVCVLHIAAQYLLRDASGQLGLTQVGYTTIVRYEQPGDMVSIVDDPAEGRELQLR